MKLKTGGLVMRSKLDSGERNIETMPSSIRVSELVSAVLDPPSTSDRLISAGEGSSSGKVTRPVRSRKHAAVVPVVIADKSALFRAGLIHILAGTRFRVIATWSNAADLAGAAIKKCIALISLDKNSELILPQLAYLAGQGVRVIILSERLRTEEVFAAIEAGADGFLLKNETSPDALLKSLELVWLGEEVVIPHGLPKLLKSRSQQDTTLSSGHPRGQSGNGLDGLSNRERMILEQLTHGASNKQIAREFNIAETTVKVHVKNLLRKIRVKNRTQAAMWARQNWRSTSSCILDWQGSEG
jgi:two-component system nitrate/nitrite response regulator NarL